MSLGEIFRIALVDTALGMGTVFLILIFISLCIWIMGILCREKKPETAGAAAAAASEGEDGLSPELVAVITAAVHQYIKDENGADDQEYIVRNVRRATWRHTS
ncbi:MAG: OadG family protein [Mogibacterium sp.]|nr:OadG family protein [Mogibacterium sp.]